MYETAKQKSAERLTKRFDEVKIPSSLIQSLQGIKDFDETLFLTAHQSPEPPVSIRLNTMKIENSESIFDDDVLGEKVPWCKTGYYLKHRPSFTFDPLFHAGCYYVQEASSMFLEQAMLQTIDFSQSLKVLDLCAAPGGKSTHLQSLISKKSLLVSNEVIRSRANTLKNNIIKWGAENVIVTNNDPKDFSDIKSFFDVMLIDAPCSGSGLFRRDKNAIDEWSENNVNLCSLRQQRIVADALPSLKQNGVLIYSTCSYSPQENEKIVDWICSEFNLMNCRLHLQPKWNITEIETDEKNCCYRFWSHSVKGEGFFISVFRKKETSGFSKITKQPITFVKKKEENILRNGIKLEDQRLVSFGKTIYALPEQLLESFDFLSGLKMIYSGTAIGEIVHEKFIPDHALAMNRNVQSEQISKTELSKEAAIAYLQRKDIFFETEKKGWQLVTYKNHTIGWVNVLSNRINNYYPKELRILKEKNL